MTDTSTTTNLMLPSRQLLDQNWRNIAKIGSVTALTMVFIGLIGMMVQLDTRLIIRDYMSLGYLMVIWVPLMAGYLVSKEVVLEGMVAYRRGPRDLLAGALTGMAGGAGLSLLAVLIDNFDIRDPFVNWSPQLLEQLTFGNGVGFAVWIWLVIGTGLGLLGSLSVVLPSQAAKALNTALLAVTITSILEGAISDLFEGFGLTFLSDAVYAKRGGLTLTSAITLGLVVGAITLAASDLAKRGLSPRVKYDALEAPSRRTVNFWLSGAGIVLLLVLPQILGTIMNELLANVGLFVLLALGLNIVVGLAGILDLGYVAFFAVGGYTTAILTSPNSPWIAPQLHFGIVILIVIVAAAIIGLAVGAPVIRMRGDYLAIVTLGFGEIIRLLFLSDWLSPYFGGAQGITNIPPIDLGFVEVKGSDPKSVFYLVIFFCAIAIYVSWRLQGSRLGRAWMAIREDEKVAEAMGINTVTAKLAAFVVGAILASFSGAIFAAKVGSIFPSSFLILVSIIILVVVIVGGMGNITGVIVGAVVLIGVLGGPKQPGLLQELGIYKLLIYGAILVFMMLKRPEGLVPNARRSHELHQEEFLQDAWLRGEVEHDAETDEGAEA